MTLRAFYLNEEDYKPTLALIRFYAMRPGGMDFEPLLEALEVDRPVERQARGDCRLVEDMRRYGFEKHERVTKLERLGQDEARQLVREGIL